MAFVAPLPCKGWDGYLHRGSVLAGGSMIQVQNAPRVIEVYSGRNDGAAYSNRLTSLHQATSLGSGSALNERAPGLLAPAAKRYVGTDHAAQVHHWPAAGARWQILLTAPNHAHSPPRTGARNGIGYCAPGPGTSFAFDRGGESENLPSAHAGSSAADHGRSYQAVSRLLRN